MFNRFKTLALSAMIGLGGLAALPAAAQADGLYLNLGDRSDTRFGVYIGDRDARHIRRDRNWRQCTPNRALDKAERIGLRRVAVRNVTRNTISVSGRDRGERVVVTFGRGPNCPIVRY